ncbi:hypothetical protein [Kribbella sp. CA-293567]|uniref:hypothetical protein n=1 Tax=Kribbella sp. CA-293567 TaxID=3002436 RepID=UPI0022DDE324|nr:hypothetical protein [Kribbella sp. CA-293567]WBQ07862.1 hypothetical protein OX958_13925 [Kribbella sp. CA-293567]
MSSPQWKIHFKSAPSEVYRAISTPLGRSRFWAESAKEADGVIHFVLPGGRTSDAPIERAVRDSLYVVRLAGHRVAFLLAPDEHRGTDLTLTVEDETDPTPGDPTRTDPTPWVSLLFRLKAHVDFGADLRNHDPARTTAYLDGC